MDEKAGTAADVLNANGALAHSSARALDKFTDADPVVIIMTVVTVFSVLVSFYLIRQLISLIKEGIKSNYELRGAIRDALDRDD
ncbi:MAG: hypothetical protein E6Q97_14860 [Desulfurellales bacterium]|nr:MAG: hypothetical protein E6Q97_14860 [Desulfurellales bacterium]